jgi:hypothetical protein
MFDTPMFCGLTGRDAGYITPPNQKMITTFTGTGSTSHGCTGRVAHGQSWMLEYGGVAHREWSVPRPTRPVDQTQPVLVFESCQRGVATSVGFFYGTAEDYDSQEENVGENFWYLDKHPELRDR